jgi:hypothetical protein
MSGDNDFFVYAYLFLNVDGEEATFQLSSTCNLRRRGAIVAAFNGSRFYRKPSRTLPGNPGATLHNPATFGRITALAMGATPRIWQFAVKYVF